MLSLMVAYPSRIIMQAIPARVISSWYTLEDNQTLLANRAIPGTHIKDEYLYNTRLVPLDLNKHVPVLVMS